MRSFSVSLCSLVIWSGLPLAAQQQPAPTPRPAQAGFQQIDPPEPQEGQGIELAVRVLDAATGDGVPDVLVELKREPVINSAQGAADRRRWSYSGRTDVHGQSTVSKMLADRYSIDATLKGYALAAGTDKTLVITPGAKPSPLTLRMWKASVVEGVVEDHEGRPVADAGVEILLEEWTGGMRTLALAQAAVPTDKAGKFLFPAVLPGTYYLRATANQGLVQQQLKDSDKLQATEKDPAPEKHVAFVNTIYPAATELDSAAPLTIYPGIDQHGVRIEMQKRKYYSFSGRVTGAPSDQRGALGLFYLVDSVSIAPFIASNPYSGDIVVQLAPDGTFSTPSVPPGPYYAGYMPAGQVRGGAPFQVVDRDVTDFRAEVSEGLTFHGKAVYEDGTAASPMMGHMGTSQGALGVYGVYLRDFGLNQKGEFSSPGLPEGTYRLEFPNGSVVVRKIELDGRTFPGGTFELRRGGGEAVITLSRDGGTISGSVDLDERDRSYPRGVVTITPEPQRTIDNSRQKRLDGSESFVVDHLETGRYRVCAWLEEGSEIRRVLGNPRFEQRLGGSCKTVNLDKDEKAQVELKQISVTDFK
jgi:protocatechuate 3,4-dioxygenase beta subunit